MNVHCLTDIRYLLNQKVKAKRENSVVNCVKKLRELPLGSLASKWIASKWISSSKIFVAC